MTKLFDVVRRDVAYGWRSLWRTPGASGVIVTSLAVVIGANAAIFGLVDLLYLRRLNLPAAHELGALVPTDGGRVFSLDYAQYRSLTRAAPNRRLAAFRFEPATISTPAGPSDAWVDMVSGEYFALLGVRALLGRTIGPEDEARAAPVAVISEEFWASHFGRRFDAVGQMIRVNDLPVTVIGVMPRRVSGVHFARRFRIALPFTMTVSGFPDTRTLSTTIIARVPAERRQSSATALATLFERCCAASRPSDIRADHAMASTLHFVPVDDPPTAQLVAPAGPTAGLRFAWLDASRGLTWSAEIRGRFRGAFTATCVGVVLLLLIACANVATILLARGEARAREFAIRRALGAGPGRLRAQLLTEGLMLSLLAAGAGIPLALGLARGVVDFLPASVAAATASVGLRELTPIILFTCATALLCTMLTVIWPARRATRDALLRGLTGSQYDGDAPRADRWLVSVQLALAVVLVTAASLFVQTVRNLVGDVGGYASSDVVLASINARGISADSTEWRRYYDRLRLGVSRFADVRAVGLAYNAPLVQDGLMQWPIRLPGEAESRSVRTNIVSPGFFPATGVEIAAGREFSSSDDAQAPRVAIVSDAFARAYFAGRSPIGAEVDLGTADKPRPVRIVGVARDAHYDRMAGLGTDLRTMQSAVMYLPLTQTRIPSALTMIVRPIGDPFPLIGRVGRLARSRNGVYVRGSITTVERLLNEAAARERFAAAFAIGFGVVALLLAGIGVLGVLSFHVARRSREIGIRMALGANATDTLLLILRQSGGMLGVALLVGMPVAEAMAVALKSQLFGVAPLDVRAVGLSVLVLLAIAGMAMLVPARHATRVDPMIALRSD